MQFNRFPASAVTGIALTGALVSGCGQNPELTFSPDKVTLVQADGFIFDDVNVRTSPQRIENEAGTNSCGRTDAAVILEAAEVAISEGIGIDSNGDWVGVKAEDLPSNLAEDCNSQYGGMLWIAKKYISAEITLRDQPAIASE